MSVIYRRNIIAKGAKTRHFKDKGISITTLYRTHVDKYQKFPHVKFVFEWGIYMGIIRTSCYGDTFCVDVHHTITRRESCLTTDCKNIQEAKDILYAWFKYPDYPSYLKH